MAADGRGWRRLRRFAVPAIGIAASVAGFLYVYRDLDLSELVASSARIEPLPLAGTIAAYWLGTVLIRSFLVRLLLRPVGAVGAPAAYRYICIGFLANNVLPFRAGDMARSVAIHKGAGLRFSSVVGALAVERMLDMGMVAVIALLTVRFAAALDAWVRTAALASGAAVAVGLVAVVVLSRIEFRERDGAAMGRVRAFLWNTWVRFSAGLKAMASWRSAALAVVMIAAIWGCTLVTMALRLEAFGLAATPFATLSLLTCLGFGVAVPAAPGYFGVYQAAAVFALVELNGADPGVAAWFATFSWILDVGIGSAAGAISLSIEGIRLGDLRRRAPAGGAP